MFDHGYHLATEKEVVTFCVKIAFLYQLQMAFSVKMEIDLPGLLIGTTWAVALDICNTPVNWPYLFSALWPWIRLFYKNILLMLDFLRAPLFYLHLPYYALMTFLMMLSVILLLLILPSTLKCDQASNLWQKLKLASEIESDLQCNGLENEMAR